jgi:hypothetical protein
LISAAKIGLIFETTNFLSRKSCFSAELFNGLLPSAPQASVFYATKSERASKY